MAATVMALSGKKVVLPIALKGIAHGAPVNDLALRRRCRIGIEAPGGPFAEPGAGSRCALTMILEVGHIQSHLLVGDGFIGQSGSSV